MLWNLNSIIYHSFLSHQPLAPPHNISPTRIGNPIDDPHGMINFSNRSVTGLWYLKTPNKIWIKRFQKYSSPEFWIMKVVTGLFSFCRFCQFWIFCSEDLQKLGLASLRVWNWIRFQFVDDVRYSLSSPQNQIN